MVGALMRFSEGMVERLEKTAAKLEENVRLMINGMNMETLSLLELIDDKNKIVWGLIYMGLGLSYRFEEDINKALDKIVSIEIIKDQNKKSMYQTALLFGILGQHGFDVSQAEINKYLQGMLSLYETSYLNFEGESLWEANAFSRTHLMNSLMKEGVDAKMAEQVRHVLEGLPYHQSFHILEARWWWRDIGLASKLSFARDRLVEAFCWSLAMFPQPQFNNCHNEITKVGILLVILDDVYDIYGTLDELELFTNAVERWKVNSVNTLPDRLVLCLMAVYNTVNAMVYEIFKGRGIKILPYLTKVWSNVCKAFLQEAKWFYNKVIPPFNEFLENARISSTARVILTPSYFLVCQDQDITEQALHSLINYHDRSLHSPL
ncbi:hypothetical protein GYH30_033280 [Glycine max]|uniref:Terpene synthase metal-binding domain-containing protein n=1 Tax=Glycine max TaxID=3847 RepID=A0A0R0H3H1_SOYBN|nr:hypothetical protein GYH30_033280 [Glycine max]